jgi:glycosyltransferase involved in cell wall biosynthesis
MSTSSVSVIIPTYNRAYVVGEAIESVLRQTVPVDEIIVVDDGSTDDTAQVLRRFGHKITVISQPNLGVSAARNAGIQRAMADWITFLDSDDIWHAERISILKRDISETHAGVHVANIEIVYQDHRYNYFEVCKNRFPRDGAEQHESGFDIWIKQPSTLAFAARRDWILKVGGFDASMRIREDYDFFARLMTVGPWLVTSAVVGELRRFRGKENSLSSLRQTEPAYTSLMEIKLCERVLSISALGAAQSNIVRMRLSSSQFNLAYALARDGQASKSRALLLRSAHEHPTVKGWLRALPPLLLADVGYRLVFLGRQARSFALGGAVGHALEFR